MLMLMYMYMYNHQHGHGQPGFNMQHGHGHGPCDVGHGHTTHTPHTTRYTAQSTAAIQHSFIILFFETCTALISLICKPTATQATLGRNSEFIKTYSCNDYSSQLVSTLGAVQSTSKSINLNASLVCRVYTVSEGI